MQVPNRRRRTTTSSPGGVYRSRPRQRQVQHFAGRSVMDIAPMRISPPRESVVTQDHDAFNSHLGAPSRKQEVQEVVVGHRARLNSRDVQAVPLTCRLGRHAKELLAKNPRGVPRLGVVELDASAELPHEPRPGQPSRCSWHGTDPTVGFRCSDEPQPSVGRAATTPPQNAS